MKKFIKSSLLISLLSLNLLAQENASYVSCIQEVYSTIGEESIQIIEDEHVLAIGDISYPICLFNFSLKIYRPNYRIVDRILMNQFNLVNLKNQKNDQVIFRNKSNLIPITSDFDLEWANYSYDEQKRWPSLNIPIYISKDFSEKTLTKLKKAMRTIENSSLVRFIPIPEDQFCLDQAMEEELGCPEDLPNKRTYYVKIDPHNKPDTVLNFIYLRVSSNPGYFGSELGKKPEYYISAATRVTIGEYVSETIATHELLHSLGLDHTFCRYDRDKYITMNWDHEIHQTLSNQFIRNNISNEYLNYYEIINGHTEDYLDNNIEYISDLLNIDYSSNEMNFSQIFELDPYHILGSQFKTHSVLFYPDNKGFTADNGSEVSVTLQSLPFEEKIEQNIENGIWTFGLAEEDGNRLSFHLMHKKVIKNLSSEEFGIDDELPRPAYLRYAPGSESSIYVGLPNAIDNYREIGIYAIFYRGNSANPEARLPYGGVKIIHLDHIANNQLIQNGGEVKISLNRMDQAEINLSSGGKFNSDLFSVNIGFYRITENQPNINQFDKNVIRYLGPQNKVVLRKYNNKIIVESNPLAPINISNLDVNIFPNPVKQYGPINIDLISDESFSGNFSYEVTLRNLLGQIIGKTSGESAQANIIWKNPPSFQGIGLIIIRIKPEQSNKWEQTAAKKIFIN
ncbi:M12 family metallopeptidase [Bacteriovoracaceae bacterium]|nr:M12 family metallopeptidase [Bacteriovoracaceae bacterium]